MSVLILFLMSKYLYQFLNTEKYKLKQMREGT